MPDNISFGKDRPYFDQILQVMDHSKFVVPTEYSDDYFPDFLEKILSEWVEYYETYYMRIFQSVHWLPEQRQWQEMLNSIRDISKKIIEAVSKFYEGDVFEATSIFNKSLDTALYDNISLLNNIAAESCFYRARLGGKLSFRKSDLFHVPFEKRHLIGTNRYSIPGLPALYLGGSTHICWAELDRSSFRDMQFSLLKNTREVRVIRIERFKDFIKAIPATYDDHQKLIELSKYLITYPLTIACTIKVREPHGHFKPEYIIPQLLLQYVAEQDNIDGIMYPSTKIDYDSIKDIPSYNYIFPVKSSQKKGFCPSLVKHFHITEPTSLDIEEMSYNRKFGPMVVGGGGNGKKGQLELTKGIINFYVNTAFGRIEEALDLRKATTVTS